MSAPTRAARRRQRPTAGAILGSVVFTWVATAIAATAFWPVYESVRFVVMVAVTTVVASVIAVVGALVRLQAHLVVLAVLVAYLVLGVPLAVPDGAMFGVLPTMQGLVDLAVGSSLGWKQLLTITLPVGSFQALLVPAFILVLVTVSVGLSTALRATVSELAVAGPAILFVSAIAFGATTEFFPVTLALALTGVLLLWIVWFRMQRRSAAIASVTSDTDTGPRVERVASMRAAVSAVALIAIASGGALAATAVAPPDDDRRVLRSAVVQPFDPRDYPSPLSTFRRYHQSPQASAAILTIDGLPEGSRIRIATLDSYDGVVYAVGSASVTSQSGSFTLVPSRFDQSATTGTPVTVDVTVGAYSGVWVPTVGQLSAVDFIGSGSSALRDSFYYNDVSGSAAAVEELAEGDRYELDAVRPDQPAASEIASLEPGDAPVPGARVVPDELSVTLDRYVSEVDGTGARLAAAIEGLQAEGYISHGGDGEPTSRSGHSADRINQLLTDPRMIGDEEQYAVTAALMARELGFPARVVVGFAPEVVDGEPTVVRGTDISAWIEVDTASSGWVTIDPTPPVREIPEELPEEPTRVARPQQPVQPPLEEPEVRDEQSPPDTVQEEPESIDPLLAALLVVLRVVGWLAVVAAVVSAPFIAIVAAKLRRRRRRRKSPDPLQRIRGGWDEFEDAVLDHGYLPPESPTRSEFAAMVGDSTSLVLAAATDRAVFSPAGPDREDADRVWDSVGELRGALDTRLTRRQRFAALVSLRSFRARSTGGEGS